MKQIILFIIVFAFYSTVCLPQTNQTKKTKLSKTTAVEKNDTSSATEQEEARRLKEEASYYAPIRYVIVYNDIFKLSSEERRMEILIDEKQLNEENLTEIFELIKKRFPLPLGLEINVHTSVATIETPEEREMVRRGDDPRFAHTYGEYKSASYSRFDNGREAFMYTTSLSPYKEKLIVIKYEKFK